MECNGKQRDGHLSPSFDSLFGSVPSDARLLRYAIRLTFSSLRAAGGSGAARGALRETNRGPK